MQEHEKEAAKKAFAVGAAVGLTLAAGALSLPAMASLAAFKEFALNGSGNAVKAEYLENVWAMILQHSEDLKLQGKRLDDLEQVAHRADGLAQDAQGRLDAAELATAVAQATADVAGESAAEALNRLRTNLEERGAPATELMCVLEAGYQAWRSADGPIMRHYVLAGIRSALFDDQFDNGQRIRLLDILCRLHGYEVDVLLATQGRAKTSLGESERVRDSEGTGVLNVQFVAKNPSPIIDTSERLQELRLVRPREHSSRAPVVSFWCTPLGLLLVEFVSKHRCIE